MQLCSVHLLPPVCPWASLSCLFAQCSWLSSGTSCVFLPPSQGDIKEPGRREEALSILLLLLFLGVLSQHCACHWQVQTGNSLPYV